MRLSWPPPHRAGSSPHPKTLRCVMVKEEEGVDNAYQRFNRAPVGVDHRRVARGVPKDEGVEPIEVGEHRPHPRGGPVERVGAVAPKHELCAAQLVLVAEPVGNRPAARERELDGARGSPARSRASRRAATPAVGRSASSQGVSSRWTRPGCWGRGTRRCPGPLCRSRASRCAATPAAGRSASSQGVSSRWTRPGCWGRGNSTVPGAPLPKPGVSARRHPGGRPIDIT